jgi:hypothetical protein
MVNPCLTGTKINTAIVAYATLRGFATLVVIRSRPTSATAIFALALDGILSHRSPTLTIPIKLFTNEKHTYASIVISETLMPKHGQDEQDDINRRPTA